MRRLLGRGMLALLAAFVMVIATLAAPPANAEQTELEKAKQRVKQLETEASEIDEQYAEVKIQLEEGERRVKQLRKDIADQTEIVEQLDEEARMVALVQFQGRGIDPTIKLFSNADPENLLDQISTASKVGQNLNNTLQEHQLQKATLADMTRSLGSEVDALTADEQQLSQLEKDIDSKLTEAKELVEELQLQALLDAEDGGSATFDISSLSEDDVNAKVYGAIKYAVSKVKNGQYVWGAEGPNGFDCSGLMLAAYRSVGIRLPHSSRAQAGVGRAVSRSELKPGDLIFWYHPVHHVGMYIGDGKIVHARNTRSDLVIQTLNSYPAPYAGARRVVG